MPNLGLPAGMADGSESAQRECTCGHKLILQSVRRLQSCTCSIVTTIEQLQSLQPVFLSCALLPAYADSGMGCSRRAEDRKRRRKREEQDDDADREKEAAELTAAADAPPGTYSPCTLMPQC